MDGAKSDPVKPYLDSRLIRSELSGRAFRFKRRLGQNFLINPDVLDFMVTEGGISSGDLVLEVGAGPGCLTGTLLHQGARVICVEIDPVLSEVGRTILIENLPEMLKDRVRWIEGDFLQSKHRINPRVEDAVNEALESSPESRLKIVSNLPYCIATPAIINITESALPWERMVITIQEEVADRLLAKPGSSAYGQVSVILGMQSRIRRLMKLRPGHFWPKPDVESAIVELKPRKDVMFKGAEDYRSFKAYTREIFAHRRKTW